MTSSPEDAAPREPLSRSAEDYLKAIHAISHAGRPATTNQIAEALGLTPPSVTGMIKRLSEQGLLDHEPYRGVTLTGDGRREATRMVRRHRLIETYLVERLGFTWDNVHDEAERLEHAVSDVLVERMAAALGHPTVDPHGDPIPDEAGEIDEPALVPLSEVPTGQTVTIRRVATKDAERLRYLAAVGLTPGTEVSVRERQPFDGPVTLAVGAREQVLAHDVAQLLGCEGTAARAR